MKFKEIKPGMVIHCQKEEDARALYKHCDIAYSPHTWNTRKNDTCYHLCGIRKVQSIGYGDSKYYLKHGFTITEFSDLIEPDDSPINSDTDSPMTAKELLLWMDENKGFNRAMQKIFNGYYSTGDVFDNYNADDIIQRITAYEAAKKAPKLVEVEYGWYCEILKMGKDGVLETVDQREMWEDDQKVAMDEAAERARQYVIENGLQTYFRVHGICRVKEDES